MSSNIRIVRGRAINKDKNKLSVNISQEELLKRSENKSPIENTILFETDDPVIPLEIKKSELPLTNVNSNLQEEKKCYPPCIQSVILGGNLRENGDWTSGQIIDYRYSATGVLDLYKGDEFVVDCNQLRIRKDIPPKDNPFYFVKLYVDFDSITTPFKEFSVLFKWNQTKLIDTECIPPVLISLFYSRPTSSGGESISLTNTANWSTPDHWHVFNLPGEALLTLKVNDDCTSVVVKSMSPTLFLAV